MSVSEIQRLEFPFSSEEKVQMLVNFNRHLELEIESLREENDMLRRMLFGKKSEKIVCEKIGIDEEVPLGKILCGRGRFFRFRLNPRD